MRSDAMKSGILCLSVAGALVSMQAQAVGLGAIEVKSKLDQPFVAEIPLTINSPDEASDLVVRIASPEAFERVGMDPRELSANLQFSVGKNARGEAVVRVTTPQRMNDPYVTFLVEADWGKGKMVREYTALLDPPHTASVPKRGISAPTVASTPLPAPAPMPRVTPPVAAPATPEPSVPSVAVRPLPPPPPASMQVVPPPPPAPVPDVPAPAPEPIVAAPQPVPAAPPPAAQASEPLPPPSVAEASSPPPPAPMPEASKPVAPKPESAQETPDAVTVNRGQTLSAIADQVRPGDVSVNRMMIALERANPDAFIGNNINLLKSGAVLRIPASADAQAVTAAEANALVHEQVESWRQGAQPAPQLQPEETADKTAAKAAKSEASIAAAAADRAAATKAKAASAAAHGSDKSAAAPKTDTTASVPKVSKPRGAHLEIVPPIGNASANSQSGASEGGSGSELRAQLAQTKEELTARNAEVSDLKSKVGDLEKMQTDSQKLLSMKDSQLAAMQQHLTELEKHNVASPAASSATSAPADSSEPASASASTANDATASASPVSTSPAATDAATAPKPAIVAAPNKPAAQPAEPEPAEPWYMQPFVLISGGLAVLGGLLLLMLRRPRQAEPPPRARTFDTGALAASMAAARIGADAQTRAPAPPDPVDSQSNRTAEYDVMPQPVPTTHPEPVAPVELVAPVATAPAVVANTAVVGQEDDWAIPGEPKFVQEPEPGSVAPERAPNATGVRPAFPSQEGPQTVATKLELARAYIDIGDGDGARSVLEEILIEGNAAQQQAAFELLDTLDG